MRNDKTAKAVKQNMGLRVPTGSKAGHTSATAAVTAPVWTTLSLIRHAEVEKRYHHVFGGRIDMKLSPRGRRQASALAEYLHQHPFDAFYASPMRRVQETLAPLMLNGTPTPVVVTDFREVDFGDWTGLGWEEVRQRYGVSAFEWLDQIQRGGIPNAECGRTFRARVKPALQAILKRHPGQKVAVLCHGGVICMMLSILLKMPLPRLAAFDIEYASITQVLWSPSRTKLQLLNFTPWRALDRPG